MRISDWSSDVCSSDLLVENVLRELDPGVSEACRAMGANSRQTVLWALIPEATTGILAAIVVTAIALVGYSAMSGVIGGGVLGDLALRFDIGRASFWEMACSLVYISVVAVSFKK